MKAMTRFFRDGIQVQQNVPTRNDAGESIPNWVTQYTIEGDIHPLGGSQTFKGDKHTYTTTHRLYTLSPSIKSGQRIVDTDNSTYMVIWPNYINNKVMQAALEAVK